jgi:putative addiction module component (TIGR02574 family)
MTGVFVMRFTAKRARSCPRGRLVYNLRMTSEAKILIEKAKSLPASDREDILEALLASLQREPAPEADQAWRDLIDERLAALDNGDVALFDFDEIVAKLRGK